jgi:hypothetical protein
MMHDTELLQYIYKTADMGCEGIQSVVGRVQNAPLKKRLEDQNKEYQKILSQAQAMLEERNEVPQGVGAMAKMSAGIMATGKMLADGADSKIAEMAIEGNQTGINKTIKHLNDYNGKDKAVRALAEKLLAIEEANAEQMKPFL